MPRYDFDTVINRRGHGGIKWNLYPEDVLPMWIADSDFRSPDEVVAALVRQAEYGVFGYTDSSNPEFGLACARWMKARFGWEADPSWVEFAPGVCAALALCVKAYTAPGDNIVMFTPTYPPFYVISKNNGRNPVSCPLISRGEGLYVVDFSALEEKLAHPKARLLFLCNPQNPTGHVFSREDLLEIGALCLKHDVLVISDEIHCDYVFPGRRHIPFPSLSKELAEISLVAINPSKTFNLADLHTAAVISPSAEMLARYRAETVSASLGKHSFGVTALSTAYNQCDDYADEVVDYVRANLEYAVDFIDRNIPKIKAYMPQSTYVLWLDCSALGMKSQDKLMNLFLEKGKLALNSGTDYGPEGSQFARMNLACPRSLVEDGLRRLKSATEGL